MVDTLAWVVTVVAVLLVLGWYLSFSASQLDRLHHRVETLRAALDAQLVAPRGGRGRDRGRCSTRPAACWSRTPPRTRWPRARRAGDGEIEAAGPAEEIENDLTRALLRGLR